MVGTVRFELTASCTPYKCASQLRYVPPILKTKRLKIIHEEAQWEKGKLTRHLKQLKHLKHLKAGYLLTGALLIIKTKPKPKISHRLNIDNHRHKTRCVLKLFKLCGINVEFNALAVVLDC